MSKINPKVKNHYSIGFVSEMTDLKSYVLGTKLNLVIKTPKNRAGINIDKRYRNNIKYQRFAI